MLMYMEKQLVSGIPVDEIIDLAKMKWRIVHLNKDVFCFRNAWSLNEHLQKISIFMTNQGKNKVLSITKR